MTESGAGGERPVWSGRVLDRRRALGWTQSRLADAAGVTQQAVSYVERGAGVPRVTTMLKIASALGTTVESLVTGDPEAALPEHPAARAVRHRRRPNGAEVRRAPAGENKSR